MRISDWSSDVCSSDLFVRSQQIDIRVPAEGDAGILGAVNILFVDRRDQVQRSDFLQRQAVTVLFDVDRILVNLLERVRRVGEESKDSLLEAVGVAWMILPDELARRGDRKSQRLNSSH